MKRILLTFVAMITVCASAFAAISDGKSYRISPASAYTKSLFVQNSSTLASAAVLVWTETDVPAQEWTFTKANNDTWSIKNVYSGFSLARASGSPRAGVKICQSRTASYGQWNFEVVDEANHLYRLYQTNTSGEKFYLNIANANEGTQPTTEALATSGNLQNWYIEEIEPITKFDEYCQTRIMEGWKNRFYKKASSGYILGNGGWWGDAEMIETVLDAYETTGIKEYATMYNNLVTNFCSRNNTDWSGNAFNDDITWMVLASIRGYFCLGTSSYLNRARDNFDKMYARALNEWGMLRWKEWDSNTTNGTNSCINGPAEVAACYLGIATGEEEYFTKAKNLYAKQRQYLFDASSGAVWDCFTWVDNTPSNYNKWVSTYNQGTMLGAAILLYQHYGDQQYYDDAVKIANHVKTKMIDSKLGILNSCQDPNNGDLQGFKGILQRYLRKFIVDLQAYDYIDWMQQNAFHAFNNMTSESVGSTAWLTKTPENYTVNGSYFGGNPFGPSTVVSVAFNTPLSLQKVKKDAFTTINSEDFNYIRGFYREEDGDGYVMGYAKKDFHLGYNNVDFGEEGADVMNIRVSKASRAGCNIEVRLGSPTGEAIGKVAIPTDGDWHNLTCNIKKTSGVQNIYLVVVLDQSTAIANLFKIDTFSFANSTGIEDIIADDAVEVARFDIQGRRLSQPAQGINIVRYSDGSAKKVLVK